MRVPATSAHHVTARSPAVVDVTEVFSRKEIDRAYWSQRSTLGLSRGCRTHAASNPATVVPCSWQATRLGRAGGRVIRRYEHTAPGDLIHVDIKKLGNIPDGGRHKIHGRAVGSRHSTRSAPIPDNSRGSRAKLGYAYPHNAVDDHSRLAYTEILPDETK